MKRIQSAGSKERELGLQADSKLHGFGLNAMEFRLYHLLDCIVQALESHAEHFKRGCLKRWG